MNRLAPVELHNMRHAAERELSGLSSDAKAKLLHAVHYVFYLWKADHGDRSPKNGLGRKTGNINADISSAIRPIRFEEAAPYQCADFEVLNNIDLAFKLWRDGYEPFMVIMNAVGTTRIFAAIMLDEVDAGYDFRSAMNALTLLQEGMKAGMEAKIAAMSPLAESGLKFLEAQADRARKPRGKITEDGETIGSIIKNLALSVENQGESAKSLWPRLYAELEERGLAPQDIDGNGSDLRTTKYLYFANDERRSITFRQFANCVSDSRKRKKSG